MTTTIASDLKNFINKKGYGGWFTKLYPFVESRDSCNLDLAEEQPVRPTVVGKKNAKKPQVENNLDDELQDAYTTSDTKESSKDELYVPAPPRKKMKKETPNDLLREAVNSFNRIAEKDPTDNLVAYLKEDSERNRQHEMKIAEMQMKMFQRMMMVMAPPCNMNSPLTPQQVFVPDQDLN